MSTDQHGPCENRPEHLDRERLVAELTHERKETRRLCEQVNSEWARATKAEREAQHQRERAETNIARAEKVEAKVSAALGVLSAGRATQQSCAPDGAECWERSTFKYGLNEMRSSVVKALALLRAGPSVGDTHHDPPSDDGGWNDSTRAKIEAMKPTWDARPEAVKKLIDDAYEMGVFMGKIEAEEGGAKPFEDDPEKAWNESPHKAALDAKIAETLARGAERIQATIAREAARDSSDASRIWCGIEECDLDVVRDGYCEAHAKWNDEDKVRRLATGVWNATIGKQVGALDPHVIAESCGAAVPEHRTNDAACTCGSGGHPRRCVKHPEAYDAHVAAINAETAKLECAWCGGEGSKPGVQWNGRRYCGELCLKEAKASSEPDDMAIARKWADEECHPGKERLQDAGCVEELAKLIGRVRAEERARRSNYPTVDHEARENAMLGAHGDGQIDGLQKAWLIAHEVAEASSDQERKLGALSVAGKIHNVLTLCGADVPNDAPCPCNPMSARNDEVESANGVREDRASVEGRLRRDALVVGADSRIAHGDEGRDAEHAVPSAGRDPVSPQAYAAAGAVHLRRGVTTIANLLRAESERLFDQARTYKDIPGFEKGTAKALQRAACSWEDAAAFVESLCAEHAGGEVRTDYPKAGGK